MSSFWAVPSLMSWQARLLCAWTSTAISLLLRMRPDIAVQDGSPMSFPSYAQPSRRRCPYGPIRRRRGTWSRRSGSGAKRLDRTRRKSSVVNHRWRALSHG